jgi:OmpA-OmpF porin, OOP family
MRIAVAALLALFMLTACDSTGSLTELRHASPASDPYQASLADGYQQFAEAKLGKEEWATSRYFADKGLMAAYGRDVEPEDAANWQIAPAALNNVQTGREKLMAAIDANKTTQPALTASAVVAYDRWIEAVANNPDADAIDEAGAKFSAALEKLGQVQAAQPGTNAPISEPGKIGEKTTTILYFPFDSDHLGSTAKAAINQLVHDIKAAGNVSVSINGHADRAGTETYNLDLSQRRARFVEKALKAAGVSQKLLHYFAFGESDPAVPTDDGVQEPKNRRVEIFIE